jgi:hypothetical protein
LRDISDAIKIEEMPRLLRLIATQAASLLSYRNAAVRLSLSAETAKGLLAHLLGADETRVARDDQTTGKILENYVAMEVVKHLGWSTNRVRLYHYQRDREDVDLVLERADGQIVAIEVKARATIASQDYKWLIKLRERRGSRFLAGVVIHPREQTIPLGDRLWALPVGALWA